MRGVDGLALAQDFRLYPNLYLYWLDGPRSYRPVETDLGEDRTSLAHTATSEKYATTLHKHHHTYTKWAFMFAII